MTQRRLYVLCADGPAVSRANPPAVSRGTEASRTGPSRRVSRSPESISLLSIVFIDIRFITAYATECPEAKATDKTLRRDQRRRTGAPRHYGMCPNWYPAEGGIDQPQVAGPRRPPAGPVQGRRAEVTPPHSDQSRTGQRRSYALRVLVRCVFVRRGDPVHRGMKLCDSSMASMRQASKLRSCRWRLDIRCVAARSRPYRATRGQTPSRPSRREAAALRGLHETKAS